jgi:hypothetical protein
MCGIVGLLSQYQNGFSHDEADAFSDMLVIDSFRGMDSTGVFGVDNLANVRICKSAQHGMDFIHEEAYKDFRKEQISRGLFTVGHNRAATKGSISDRNAHPFWVDDKIVLVQNGTMRGDHKKISARTKEIEVDSEAIAHAIADGGNNIEETLQKIDSAYALVWFNVEAETLTLIRNSERPLFISYGKRNGVLFASEQATILYVMNKYLSFKDYSIPKILDVHTLYQYKITGNHYKEVITKVDTMYRFQGTHVVRDYRRPPFRHSFHGTPDQTEMAEHIANAYSSYDRQDNVLRLPSPSTATEHSRRKVELQFSDLASTELDHYHIPSHLVAAELKKVEGTAVGDDIFIEIDDYIAANKNPDCRAWHVWGSIMSDAAGDASTKLIAHWIEYDKTEAEMKDMMKETYFSAKRNSLITHRFTNSKGEQTSIVKSFVFNVSSFAEEVNTELTHAPETQAASSLH